MKKIISLLLVLMLIVGCFAACGNDTSSSSESGAGSSSQASDAGSSSDESSSEDSSESSVSETASGEKFKVGILAPAVTHGWVAGVAYYAEERCKELSDTVETSCLPATTPRR